MVVRRFLLILSAWASALAFSHPIEIRKLDELRAQFGVSQYDSVAAVRTRLKSVRVAILDKGFGPTATLERDLPPTVFKLNATYDAALIEKYQLGNANEQQALDERDEHGRVMALLLWGMTGFSETEAPEVHLLNSNGFTNFTRAVHYCLEHKIDIILFSQNWEYGGNFDGKGFINKVVSKATDAGILWVNAAGNYGRRVHNAAVGVGADGWVRLGRAGQGLAVKSNLDRNPFRAVLSWNQYTEEESSGTDKDLDLFVFDESGNEVMKSELKQIAKKDGVERGENESYVPREIVEGVVSRGTYYVKVKAKGGTFDNFDRLRVTVLSQSAPYYDSSAGGLVDPLEFTDATEGGEVMIPADHPKVIAVGERSQISAIGPTADARHKPDVVIDSSSVEFTDGQGSSGTSNAAALFAGVLSMLKAAQPGLTTENVLGFTQRERVSAAKLTAQRAGIQDLGVEVLRQQQPSVVKAIEALLGKGSIALAGQRSSGVFIAALDRSPLQLNRYFRDLPSSTEDSRDWDIYLAEATDSDGVKRVHCYWRGRKRAQSSPPSGWQQVLQQSPQRFVQVVQASRVAEGTLPVLPIWSTPTPAQLLTITGY